MTLNQKKDKSIKNVKPIIKTKTPNTKLTKENYEKLQRLTGSGFVQFHKK